MDEVEEARRNEIACSQEDEPLVDFETKKDLEERHTEDREEGHGAKGKGDVEDAPPEGDEGMKGSQTGVGKEVRSLGSYAMRGLS